MADTEVGSLIINPYIYSYSTLDNLYAYVPYKHTLLSFSLAEWKQIKRKEVDNKIKEDLIKNKVYVESNYKDSMLESYRSHFASKPLVHIVYIIATDSCNFNCTYCFIEKNFSSEKRRVLDFQTAKKWIDYAFLNSKDELRFIFYGGEPLLNKNLVEEAITYITKLSKDFKRHATISINTNGSIYSDSLAELFSSNNVSLSISLDGPKWIHDKCRITKEGKPTFDVVINNIDRYIKKGVTVSFSITVTDYNLEFLPQIAKWVTENYSGKINSVGFNPPLEAEGGNQAFSGDYELVMLQMYNAFRIFRKYGIYEDRIMRRMKKIVNEEPYLKDCAGCGNQIVVSADGSIGPCQAFIGSGKFFKKANAESYSFENDDTMKLWNSISPINKHDCANCPFILICGNGCPYYSYIKTGDLFGIDQRYCRMLPIMFNEVLKDNFYKKPKAIFTDFDNTILIRRPIEEILGEVGKEFGINYKITIDEFYKSNKNIFDVRKYFLVNGVKEEMINNVIRAYIKSFDKGAKLNNALINQLKIAKVPVYILTNSGERYIKQKLDELGISNIFSGVFGNDNYPKPSEEYYLNVFSTTRLRPEDILYIGDSIEDITPIYGYGCRVVLFSPSEENQMFNNNWLMDLIDG